MNLPLLAVLCFIFGTLCCIKLLRGIKSLHQEEAEKYESELRKRLPEASEEQIQQLLRG
jgi:hypothetical protein